MTAFWIIIGAAIICLWLALSDYYEEIGEYVKNFINNIKENKK